MTMASHLCEDLPSIQMKKEQRGLLWSHLNKQRKNGELCDITFKCNGGDVCAHKNVLATITEYFKILFASPISGAASSNVVVFDDFSVEAMTLLLDIIYSSAEVPAEHVVELMRLANYVQLDWLVDEIAELVRMSITTDTIHDWYDVASSCGSSKLKFLCECFMRENREELCAKGDRKCTDSNVLNELEVWQPDMMNREVVILNGEVRDNWMRVKGRSSYLLDPISLDLSKFHSDNESCKKLFRFWPEGDEFVYAFQRQNIFYAVTRKSKVCKLWKFQHMTRSLNFAAVIELGFCYQMLYDMGDSLYLLIDLESCAYIIVCKFDMRSLEVCKGFISMKDHKSGERGYLGHFKDHGMCLVYPEEVFHLEKHDFQVPRFDVNKLPKTVLSKSQVNSAGNLELDCLPSSWITLDAFNMNGTFYAIVDHGETKEDESKEDYLFLFLNLDMESRSWVVRSCLKTSVCLDTMDPCEFYNKHFHCGSTIYLRWKDPYKDTSPRWLALDEGKSSFRSAEFSFEPYVNSYVVVPYHVFL